VNQGVDKIEIAEEHGLTEAEKRETHLAWNIIKTILITLAVLLILVLLKRVIGTPLRDLSIQLVDEFGLAGIFATVLFIDTFIVPMSPDIVIFVSVASARNPFVLVLTMSAASVLAGQFGYIIGKALGHTRIVRHFVKPYMRKGHYMVGKYGIWAVVIASLTPVPYSTICWLAGMMDMKYSDFFISSLWRVPRFFLWYMIIRLGWVGFH